MKKHGPWLKGKVCPDGVILENIRMFNLLTVIQAVNLSVSYVDYFPESLLYECHCCQFLALVMCLYCSMWPSV